MSITIFKKDWKILDSSTKELPCLIEKIKKDIGYKRLKDVYRFKRLAIFILDYVAIFYSFLYTIVTQRQIFVLARKYLHI